MIVAIHQPNFLPWLGFFHKMASCDIFVFLDNVQFTKRSIQNRNKIKTAKGPMWLTVPVATKGRYFQRTQDVEINNEQNWRETQWKAIVQNYRRARYFDDYAEPLEKIYSENWSSLVELNAATIRMLQDALEIKPKCVFASQLEVAGHRTELLINLCQALGGDTYLSGPSGRKYMDEASFSERGIGLLYRDFNHPEYDQLYPPFVPDLSALDMVLNCGPKSREILLEGDLS